MITSQIFQKINTDIKSILQKALSQEEISPEEALKLFKVTGKEFIALQMVADQICSEKKNEIVTFVINRNINFTNVCYQGCKFCSFSVSNINNDAFTLTVEDIREKVLNAVKLGITEVCIQGGINPELNYDFYLDILKTIKKVNPRIHIHAFSPQEIFHLSELFGENLENTLKDLKLKGLDSIPGTAAEILDDKIRKIICPNKVSVAQWREIVSTAHKLDIPTTCTMMYGHIEDLKDRINHLNILRDIQKETNGFTEFIPLLFIKEKPVLSRLKEFPLNHCYGMADLKLYSVARLFFNNYIDNIQCSWVKLGTKFAQVTLNYGVNDFSGTLMEENISKSAGSLHGEYLSTGEIIQIIKSAGKRPAQRDTFYNILKIY